MSTFLMQLFNSCWFGNEVTVKVIKTFTIIFDSLKWMNFNFKIVTLTIFLKNSTVFNFTFKECQQEKNLNLSNILRVDWNN